ncbi:MAG: HigA family addiction module antidote protein [Deltaproteobacteria bacterium]|jgi:addiction module HigA family antidote|nr:HigA family addiction module antidote protein [Deltaproteobacteria bacterium]
MLPVERIFTHPGEMLREEFMLPMQLSANALATGISVPVSRILDILHERRGISADTAARLAKYFGTSERFWTNLQAEYDLSVVRSKKKADLERIVPHVYATSVVEAAR